MEGRERGDRSAAKQFLLLDEDWSHAGWRALEATCSPEDPPHLEVTQSEPRESDFTGMEITYDYDYKTISQYNASFRTVQY